MILEKVGYVRNFKNRYSIYLSVYRTIASWVMLNKEGMILNYFNPRKLKPALKIKCPVTS